jgi:hypothetical protein
MKEKKRMRIRVLRERKGKVRRKKKWK